MTRGEHPEHERHAAAEGDLSPEPSVPRCRYHRWVGLGVIADNLINVARYLDRRAAA